MGFSGLSLGIGFKRPSLYRSLMTFIASPAMASLAIFTASAEVSLCLANLSEWQFLQTATILFLSFMKFSFVISFIVIPLGLTEYLSPLFFSPINLPWEEPPIVIPLLTLWSPSVIWHVTHVGTLPPSSKPLPSRAKYKIG